MRRVNILISSAGRRVALLHSFRRALSSLGLEGEVLATDISRLSSAFQSADDGVLVPRCTSADFIPAMLEVCKNRQIALVVPTIDTELPVYAEHRDAFERIGTRIAVSAPEVVEIGGDKIRTHSWLVEKGFPTVRQATLAEFQADPSGWAFPLLVKPRGGSASIGVARVSNLEELRGATQRGDYLVQTIAKGHEHTIDFLADRNGRCVCAVPRRRLEVRAGEVSKAVTVRSPLLEAFASRLCAALPGAYGTLNVQLFLDQESGRFEVIEINPRFGGGFPLACQAGADFPRWILEELLGLPSTASSANWTSGLVMLRYDDAVFVNSSAAGLQ